MNSLQVFFSFGLLTLCYAAIPSYIHICKSTEPDISGCIVKSVESLRPQLKSGIPELDVPGLEPLDVDEIKLRSSGINANITDLKVWGPTNFEIVELRANIPKNRFAFIVKLPYLNFTGKYEVKAKILLLNLEGNGPISGNFTDYSFSAVLKGKRVQQNGAEYLKFDRMKLDIVLGKSFMTLENLFSGNPTLEKAANDVINDSNDLFTSEIRPVLQESLSDKFTDIANKITLKFTYNELFP